MRWLLVAVALVSAGELRAEIHTKKWSLGTVADWRYALAPIDIRLGPHEATLVVARLERLDFLRVYDVSGDGDWARVFAMGYNKGVVRGWVLLEDLRHRSQPVQGPVQGKVGR